MSAKAVRVTRRKIASAAPTLDDCRVKPIYVTGHRNPDTDSIAAAVGYAELRRRLDPDNDYVPVRLGNLNAQTRWVLERAGAPEPELLPHVLLRVRDVMRERFPLASHGEPVRTVGLIMARDEVDLVPLVDDGGKLTGVMTERALARRYVRESREASRLDAPTAIGAIAGVLEGEQLVGEPDAEVTGRVWVLAMASASLPMGFAAGDVVVVGDRPAAQRIAIEVGVGLLVITNGTTADEGTLELARARGTAVVASPLDSYVSARMITLSAPCRSLMDREPLVVEREDLVTTSRRRSRTWITGRPWSWTPIGAPWVWSRARTSSAPSPGACCSWTMPSRRRAWSAWSTPRSSRSSIITTSARSRRGCRCGRRSTRSDRRRRW